MQADDIATAVHDVLTHVAEEMEWARDVRPRTAKNQVSYILVQSGV
jgi:hypothetical protein